MSDLAIMLLSLLGFLLLYEALKAATVHTWRAVRRSRHRRRYP